MTLIAREMTVETEAGPERRLFVACPQRIDPTPITECADCELCEGVALQGEVAVRCSVQPSGPTEAALPAGAAVSTIMTAPVVCVQEDTAVENVQWLLVSRRIGAVPVVDRSGRAIGVVAKTDLLRDRDDPRVSVRFGEPGPRELGIRERELSGACARDVMTPVVFGVAETTSIAAAASRMAHERVHRLLVVDAEGRLRGIVSTLDVVRWVAAQGRFEPREAPSE